MYRPSVGVSNERASARYALIVQCRKGDLRVAASVVMSICYAKNVMFEMKKNLFNTFLTLISIFVGRYELIEKQRTACRDIDLRLNII